MATVEVLAPGHRKRAYLSAAAGVRVHRARVKPNAVEEQVLEHS
jgi:hypothetical protein